MKFRASFIQPALAATLGLLASLAAASAADFHLRINAGGPTVGEWESDAAYAKGGAAFPFHGDHDASEVPSAAPNGVYQTVRHLDHRYTFPELPDGDYVVRLHFSDGFSSKDRAMDYRFQGETLIDDLSVYEAAGKRTNVVIVRDIPVRVRGGKGLQIECLRDRGNDVFEAAVEVLSADRYADLMKGEPVARVRKVTMVEPVAPAVKSVPKLPAIDLSDVSDKVSRDLLRLTNGRRVRLVWAEVDSPGDLMVTNGTSTRLFGLDTGDDRGERQILKDKGGYSKPLLSPSGEQIIFTNQKYGKCYLLNWDGTGLKEFAKGFASDFWRDPATGIDWVYIRNSVGNANGAMVRRQLDNPKVVETVWDKSPNGNTTVPWFRLSADGKVAADAFPWPKCGIADLEKGTWQLRGNGCWTSIAPDNSYRFFHFMGNHVELAMFDHGATKPRMIAVNTMENMAGKKAYHPRWSSDSRFITMTGPERNTRSELYLGRFDAEFTRVEEWVRVTKDKRADYYGAAWIEPLVRRVPKGLVARPVKMEFPVTPSEVTPSATKAVSKPDPDAKWPGSHDGLIYLWESNSSENQVLDSEGGLLRICSGELRGQARFTRHFGLDLRSGSFEADRIADELLAAAKGSNELSLEVTLMATDTDQHGPARIITFSSGSSSRNFTLGQEGDQLVMRLRTPSSGANATSPEIRLGQIEAGQASHVLVRYRDGQLDAFINGEQSASSNSLKGGFENWEPQRLVFGDEVGGDRNWRGLLEGVAIYDRALSDEEVAWHSARFQERFADRVPADRLVVEAELLEASRVPEVSEIGSYRRSLVYNLYRIRKIISGKAPAEESIVVTEWGVLDRQPVAGAPGKVGETRLLTLEPYDQHPELKSDWSQNDLSAIELQVFHRIEP